MVAKGNKELNSHNELKVRKGMDMEDLDPVQQSMLLLVGASPNGTIDSEVRIQKLAFLFSKSLGDRDLDEGFDFEPYDLGPYSENLATAIELLGAQGLLAKDSRRNRYMATGTGLATAIKLAQENAEWSEVAQEVVRCLGAIDPNDLVAAVYELYPKYTTKSKIIEQTRMRRAVDSIVVPLERGKTSGQYETESRLGKHVVVKFAKNEIQLEETQDH